MRPVSRFVALIALVLVMVPTMSSAQFRGLGRITGTVTEEGGGPLTNVSIRATLAGEEGVIEERSDEKGAWAVSGVAKGEWHLTFQIAGYVPVGAKVVLPAELARVAPISITLKKVSKG
jgi:Carboxypeptidase regulatory-like domain